MMTWQGVGLLIPLGAVSGFVNVAVFTWIQWQVAPALLGRMATLVMFINMILTPTATTLTGLSLRAVSPATLFAVSGATLVAIVAVVTIATPIRQIREVKSQEGRSVGCTS
jgi:hypothetical protein